MKIDLEYYDDNGNRDPDGLNFVGLDVVETGAGGSAVIDRDWLRVVVARGTATYCAFWEKMEAVPVDNTGWINSAKYDPEMKPPNKDWHEAPKGTRRVWIEGKRSSKNTVVTARLLPLGK